MQSTWQTLTTRLAGMLLVFGLFAFPAAAITPTEMQKLLAADGASWDLFGMAVAVSGDIAVIGAPYDGDVGSAYVFHWNGSAWAQHAKLVPSNPVFQAFGNSVAVDGSTIVIGAPNNADGAAHIFVWDGAAWEHQQEVHAGDAQTDDQFGYAVAIDGDTVVIGANRADVGGVGNAGAVYVFTRSLGTWTEQEKLTVGGAEGNDSFGDAVAIAGDTVVIGASRDDNSSGSAYVFTRSLGDWTQQERLVASDSPAYGSFGVSVAVDGDTAIVGAQNAADGRGFAYVFTRAGTDWTEQGKLAASDGAAFRFFGCSVAVVGNTALIGAYADDAPVTNGGAAYVFTRSAGSWIQQAKLTASDAAVDDFFGRSVALGNGQALIGAIEDDDKSAQSGSVYVFSLAQPTDTTPPEVTDVTAADVVYPADPIVTATATDAGSNLRSAEYSFEGGDWTMMAASDDAFDEQSEGLTATIPGPLAVDTYEVCVRATDTADNASDGEDCDTFAVTAAAMTIRFDGEFLDLNGSPTLLKATVGGPDACKQGATVEFYEGSFKLGQATTNASGIAQLSLSGLSYLVHEIKAVVLDRDFDEDGATECTGDDDTGTTVVADPNASSTGGGWYFVDLGPGSKYKLNFGYTVQRKYDRKAGDWLTSGNVLWISNNAYKLKGRIDEGGKLPVSECASGFAACAAFGGDGVLYEHNPDYSAYYCSLGETYRCAEWVNPQPVTFTFFANDGGTSKVCTTNAKGKTTCKESLKPDAFGMQLDIVSLSEESSPTLLNGGNVVVK